MGPWLRLQSLCRAKSNQMINSTIAHCTVLQPHCIQFIRDGRRTRSRIGGVPELETLNLKQLLCPAIQPLPDNSLQLGNNLINALVGGVEDHSVGSGNQGRRDTGPIALVARSDLGLHALPFVG